MIHDSKWWFSFIAGIVLLLWSVVLILVLSYHLELGPGLGLFFLTVGVFILMALMMLVFVFFRQTRLISFGLAVPLLVLQIGLLVLTRDAWEPWIRLLVNLPGWIALLVVGITYVGRGRYSGRRFSAIE